MALRKNWKDLELVRNRTKIYELCIRNKTTGQLENIEDYIVYFTVKKQVSDEDSEAIISKKIGAESGCDYDHAEASSGKTLIILTPTDTNQTKGNYYYDMIIKKSEDDVIEILTGRIRITEPIRKETT